MLMTVERPRVVRMSEATGAELRARRLQLGLDVLPLAKRAGIDRATLTRIEEGSPTVRSSSISAVERALSELEAEIGMDDPEQGPRIVRFVVRGVYGAESLVVEGPVESIAELERSVDRIMRRLRDSPDEP